MSNQFSYKVFREGDDTLLAISDLTIIGKVFEEKDLQIEVSKDFYHDKECNSDHVKKLFRNATIINAVGKNIISLMVKDNLVEKESVLIIGGVPHAQVIKIKS